MINSPNVQVESVAADVVNITRENQNVDYWI